MNHDVHEQICGTVQWLKYHINMKNYIGKIL